MPNLTDAVILMLTSGDHRGDFARCRELGVSAYLTKPVRRAELRSAMVKAMADQSRAQIGTVKPETLKIHGVRTPPRVSKCGILLVEDNIVNQRVARLMLEKAGHGVVVASNGREALRLLAEQAFDLVLMDIQMPEMGGLEATAAIREAEQRTGAHIPVIAMTAHAMTGDRERCLSAGMDGYISKPVQSAALLELVTKWSGKDWRRIG
jgi:two-component system, sensor histidine kinase and response regulator